MKLPVCCARSRKALIIVALIVETAVLCGIFMHCRQCRVILPPSQQVRLRDQSVHTEAYTSFLHAAPISKDLVVRSVYFDDRVRNGHESILVFLVAIKRSIFDSKLIVGCGSGNQMSLNFTVRFTEEDHLMHNWLAKSKGPIPFPHEEFILECYDLSVTNQTRAYVMYKTSNDSTVYVVDSEHPLIIPAPRVQPSGKYNFTVVTCTVVHSKNVSWLLEFIRYQRTIGVDHVYLNILDSFIKDGGFKAHLEDPHFAQAMTEGFVTVSVWTDWYESKDEIYNFSVMLRKLDCVYRFRGMYDYAFLLDPDDFFTPQIPGKHNLKDYILDWCYDTSTGSCTFHWLWYYPGACGMRNEYANDGNITSKLKSYKIFDNGKFKSVHLTSAILDSGYHHADCEFQTCLLPGYKVVYVPQHVAYVAHLRNNAKPPRAWC
jgi:hypothetical protein